MSRDLLGIAIFALAVLALLMLFFGQRMAKDYGGAAGLVPYFLVAVLSLSLMGIP